MNLKWLPREISEKIEKCLELYNRGKTVLLIGETGVGKSFLAEELHRASKWSTGEFVRVDLSSIESDLFESELFGYEKGAFTGALMRGKKVL